MKFKGNREITRFDEQKDSLNTISSDVGPDNSPSTNINDECIEALTEYSDEKGYGI